MNSTGESFTSFRGTPEFLSKILRKDYGFLKEQHGIE